MSSICVYRSSKCISEREIEKEWDSFSSTGRPGFISKIEKITNHYLPQCRSIQEIFRVYEHFKIDRLHALSDPDEIRLVFRFILLGVDKENLAAPAEASRNSDRNIKIMEKILFRQCGYRLQISLIPIFVQYSSNIGFHYQQLLMRVKNRKDKLILIDQSGRCYKNLQDWIKNNKLSPCSIILPKDGILKFDSSGKPITEQHKSPSTQTLPKLLSVSDILIGVGTVGLGAASLLTGGIAIPSLFIGGQIIATIYYTGRGLSTLRDKRRHKDSYSNSRKLNRFVKLNQVQKTCLIIEEDDVEQETNSDSSDKTRMSDDFIF